MEVAWTMSTLAHSLAQMKVTRKGKEKVLVKSRSPESIVLSLALLEAHGKIHCAELGHTPPRPGLG